MNTNFRRLCFKKLLQPIPVIALAAGVAAGVAGCGTSRCASGYTDLFDGQSLVGWKYIGEPGGDYFVTNGVIDCPAWSHGNLLTERVFTNFTLHLEYQYEAGGNNGVAIRAPDSTNNLTYVGTEIQMLDDTAPKHRNLKPWQYNGSVYGVVAAKNGAGIIGQWNTEEITYRDRHVRIVLNGRVIVNADLNEITDLETLQTHPGMLRDSGHLGFLAHTSHFQFRHIRIKELPAETRDNLAPAGFTRLFDGQDLKGWSGLVANPPARAKMSANELSQAQTKANAAMKAHWRATHGEIRFDGNGENLGTAKDYRDFELLVDWKIPGQGAGGIGLRGSPRVQIQDPHGSAQPSNSADGSGGLSNNEKNPRHPLLSADRSVGEWNRFRIVMVGEKVHVFLNNELVVNNTTLENYWERQLPIYATGQIELQNDHSPLWFKNIYIREIPSK